MNNSQIMFPLTIEIHQEISLRFPLAVGQISLVFLVAVGPINKVKLGMGHQAKLTIETSQEAFIAKISSVEMNETMAETNHEAAITKVRLVEMSERIVLEVAAEIIVQTGTTITSTVAITSQATVAIILGLKVN